MLLENKIILVSGGTRGLGAGIARAAAANGAAGIMITGRGTAGEALAAELTGNGTDVTFHAVDLAEPLAAAGSVTAAVASYGRVDCVVNSAGITTRGTLLDTTVEVFDAHIAINLRAPFFIMQAAVHDMRGRQAPGSIVNIISFSAHGGQPYLAPYVSAKAGLVGLTRNAAYAHRFDRIRINGLNIGWTETEGEDATQRTFHGGRKPAHGQARSGLGDRRVRGVPAFGSQRCGHRLGDRLGPESPWLLRLRQRAPASLMPPLGQCSLARSGVVRESTRGCPGAPPRAARRRRVRPTEPGQAPPDSRS
jgi:NAD(P)-dependent dehydrogenase (short-subunit alcohol dehydrogenase family)